MKIAIICYGHFDATIELAKYLPLVDKNLQVDLIFLLCQAASINVEIVDLKGGKFSDGFVDDKILRDTLDPEVFNYIGDQTGLNVFLFNSIKLSGLVNYKLLIQLKKYITDKQYDLVHFVGNNPWIIFLNCLIANTPKVHTIHEPYPFFAVNKYRLFRHRVKMWLLKHSNAQIILPSDTSYNRFVDNFKINASKLSMIPFGPFEIYKEYAQSGIDRADNIILYYGSISKYKGVPRLIDAMNKVSKVNPKLQLIIAGAGDIDPNVSVVNPNIKLINRYLSNKEVAELNQLAAIVVCPYTSASQSGVVMTTFAFGTPILATNVGALPEFVEDGVTGVIIEPGDPDILCETLIDLFEKPETINKLRDNIAYKYTHSEKSWLSIAKQTYQLYQEKIRQHKSK